MLRVRLHAVAVGMPYHGCCRCVVDFEPSYFLLVGRLHRRTIVAVPAPDSLFEKDSKKTVPGWYPLPLSKERFILDLQLAVEEATHDGDVSLIPVIDQTHLSFQRGQEAWLAEFEKVVGAQTEHFHSLRLTGRQGARCARIAL